MSTYVTLKKDASTPILWYKVLHALQEDRVAQIQSTDGKVAVVSFDDVDSKRT